MNLNILENTKREWHLKFRWMTIKVFDSSHLHFSNPHCCIILPPPSRHPRAALQHAGNCCSGKQACFTWRQRNKNGRGKKQNTETFIYFPHQRRQREVNVSDRLLKADLSDVQVLFFFLFFSLMGFMLNLAQHDCGKAFLKSDTRGDSC